MPIYFNIMSALTRSLRYNGDEKKFIAAYGDARKNGIASLFKAITHAHQERGDAEVQCRCTAST